MIMTMQDAQLLQWHRRRSLLVKAIRKVCPFIRMEDYSFPK